MGGCSVSADLYSPFLFLLFLLLVGVGLDDMLPLFGKLRLGRRKGGRGGVLSVHIHVAFLWKEWKLDFGVCGDLELLVVYVCCIFY